MKKWLVILIFAVGFVGKAQAQYNPTAMAPFSSSQFGTPFGGVNNPYIPTMGGAYGGSAFANNPYGAYNNSNYFGGTGMGGQRTALAGGAPMAPGSIVTLQDLLFGEGSLTSRLLQMSLMLVLGRMLQSGGGNPYLSMAVYAGMNQANNPLTNQLAQRQARPQNLNQGAQAKLSPCPENQGLGPTTAVNDLNKDLLRILY